MAANNRVERREQNRILTYIICGSVTLGILADSLIGDFPLDIFRFPLNILTMVLWLSGVIVLHNNRTSSKITKCLLSTKATWISLLIMAMMGVVLGLQVEPASDSWSAVIAIIFVLTQLSLVILRGWRNSMGIRWRYSITHVGLWIALCAGFWGAPDREQLRIAVSQSATNEAYTMEGGLSPLPYSMELHDWDIEYSDNGIATHYEAQIMIDDKLQTLRVNHPYNRTLGEKIYLVSHGTTSNEETYFVIEVVKEPWQWLSATGIVMLIFGAILMFIGGPRRETKKAMQL